MTAPSDDSVFQQLERLPPAAVDAAHSAAVLARCHAALARQRRPTASGNVTRMPQRYFGLAGAGTFAMIYVFLVIHDALATYGLFAALP